MTLSAPACIVDRNDDRHHLSGVSMIKNNPTLDHIIEMKHQEKKNSLQVSSSKL